MSDMPTHDLMLDGHRVRRYAGLAGLIGGGLIVLLLIAAIFWPHALMRSYLFAYVFWLNISLGSLGWLMLSHVTGGAWGRTTRRYTEAAAGVLPLLAILGVPLIFAASHLYAWADPTEWQVDPVLMYRRPWISTPWVAGRAAVAFALWIGLWTILRRASVAQDRTSDSAEQLRLGQQMRTVGSVGLPVLFATVFLLSVDWIMALEPHWISSVFGLVILMGQATGALSLTILSLYVVERLTGRSVASPDRVHDLGKLLLTSVVLWAYMNFSQYLIQWMGQTQEDIHWYVHRLHGAWSWVGAAQCALGLGVPLLLLLSKPLKRSLKSLALVVAWVFVMRVVDVLWTIAPSGTHGEVGSVYWSDLPAWLGFAGLWLAAFTWHLSRAWLRPLAFLTSGANVTGIVVEGGARAE